MTHDQAIREEALNTNHSYIIRAPAGSGKTELLIGRIMALLKVVDHPKRIIAITFTKKASEEMQERLLKRLFHDDKYLEIHTRAQELSWNLQKDVCPCEITTIDAWIHSWVELDYKIHPVVSCLYQEAWFMWLGLDRHHQELSKLLELFSDNLDKLGDFIISLLSRRELWVYDLFNEKPWSELMASRHSEQLINWQKEFIYLINTQEDFITPEIGDHAAWQSLANLLLTKDGNPRKRFGNEIKNKKELIRFITNLNERELLLLRYLQNSTIDDQSLLDDLHLILNDVLACLHLIFNKFNSCDFTEYLLQAINQISSKHFELDHLLLDEAQDTSQLQIHLINALIRNWKNPEQTIFIVGDPMQSIYKFRNADVRSFINLFKNGFSNHNLTSLTLSNNFRQDKILVEHINDIFKKLLPISSYLDEGVIPFSSSRSTKSFDGNINHHLLSDTDNEDYLLLEKIIDNLPHNENLALLFRSRVQAHRIIKLAQQANITISTFDLFDAINVDCLKIAINILIILIDKSQIKSWMILFRSKYIDITLAELITIELDDLLKNNITNNIKLKQAIFFYNNLPENLDLSSKWLFWLKDLGILDDFGVDHHKIITNIINHLNEYLIDFKFFTPEYIWQIFNHQRLNNHTNSRISAMSIHKAKGLEFDHIYLFNIDKSINKSSQNKISLITLNNNCLFLVNNGKNHITELEKKQHHYEDLRLLYVAMTRAKKSLHTSAKNTDKEWAKYIHN